MNRIYLQLHLVFFASGAVALMYETLWFRLAGLTFGNSVWAAAIVLMSFMFGLALGNWSMARYGDRIRRPIRFYAVLEIIVAVLGLALVTGFPALPTLLAPLFRAFLDVPWVLNPLRLSIAFFLFLVPAVAMGATLPILVKALFRLNPNFGTVLGRLYGWNTLGAVAGALVGEIVFIKYLGVRGTGLLAAALGLGAALTALAVARAGDPQAPGAEQTRLPTEPRLSGAARRILIAAFLAGACLLALEVLWFRFLLLIQDGTTLVFAVMLAVVLAGIGAGGLIGAWWSRRQAGAHTMMPSIALAAGILVVACYRGFDHVFNVMEGIANTTPVQFSVYAAALMLPVAMLSGMLFTLQGKALQQQIGNATRSAGLLTLCNTLGAALGSLLAAFVLLPLIGMERSFFVAALAYGVLAAISPGVGTAALKENRTAYAATAIYVTVLVLFPFGFMQESYFKITAARLGMPELVEAREGINETNFYYRYRRFGVPYYHRLVSNGFSMTANTLQARRYMKLYVYWAMAVHPHVKRALLISYGMGSTAKALTDTKELEHIDVVDISADVLEMSKIAFPDPKGHPLNDPRVDVHLEDGRFFLLSETRRYDLITAEPPPPKIAGVGSLFSEEFFRLTYQRLNEGGIITYWLPAHQLFEDEQLAIIRAFCNVYADCSLWAAAGLNWMLVGTRGATGHGSIERFTRQWRDPRVAPELTALGFERPAQLGSLFMADADVLNAASGRIPPLIDDRPLRISSRIRRDLVFSEMYARMMEENAARRRFEDSALIARLWPASIMADTLKFFDYQRLIKTRFQPEYRRTTDNPWAELERVLLTTSLETLPLWLSGSSVREQSIVEDLRARQIDEPEFSKVLAHRALVARNYDEAVNHWQRYRAAQKHERMAQDEASYLFALCLAGRYGEAAAAAEALPDALLRDPYVNAILTWMNGRIARSE